MNNPLTIYKDASKQWRWRITAPNGKIIGASTESYKRRRDCEQNLLDIVETVINHGAWAGCVNTILTKWFLKCQG